MSHIVNFFRKRNDGYVSLEIVILGGLVIGFGAIAIQSFQDSGTLRVSTSTSTIEEKFAVAESKLD